MSENSNSVHVLPPSAEDWLKSHLNLVRNRIIEQALDYASVKSLKDIEPMAIAEAAKNFAPGTEIGGKQRSEPHFFERIGESITGMTIVCALLAVAFAVLGIVALKWGDNRAATAAGFLDIAKVFAGAIVGSAGSNVAGNLRTPIRPSK